MTEDDIVWGGRNPSFPSQDAKVWLERMAVRGWTVPEWPQEYGGGGLSPEEARILREEMQRLGCRPPLYSFGIWMLGPVLLRYGTEAQKKSFLPPIARAEIRWAQGYSEPDAGSDLAHLQTRAEKRGDDFIINGSKVWTSYADESDWIFCLVRTDPQALKQKGISFLLIDMKQPGIKAEPIRLISGASPFCEVFFKDARTPAHNLVGPLNGGWQIAKDLLTHERQAISTIGQKPDEQSLEAFCAEKLGMIDGQLADPGFRDRLSAWHMDHAAFQLTLEREAALQRAGHSPGPTSSIFKYVGSELNKRKFELMMEASGFGSLIWEGTGSARELQLNREWLRSKGNSIEGGTSEIQLNVIAKRVLGLP